MTTKDLRSERKADVAMMAGLFLAILWFCQDLIFRGEVPFFRDLGAYFYPLRLSVAESFRTGELPLWDRRLAQGFPLLAAFQPGVFYPPHVLLAVAPFFLGIRILFVVHFIIAAIGGYKLIRYWQYPSSVAAIGALMFSLGGTVVSLTNLLNHFQSAVWLPWVLLSWEQLLRGPSWWRLLIFAVVSTLQFLAGSPEFFAMGMGLVVLDGLRMRSQNNELSLLRILGLLVGALLLVAGISMVQIVATGELFLQSRRQQLIPTGESIQWSLIPLNLLNLFLLDKEIDPSSGNGVRFIWAKESSFFVTYYMGSVSLLGIFLWAFYSAWREKLILSILTFGILILALGDYTPVYPYLLQHVSWVSAFRFPEKLFFLFYAGLLFVTIRGLGYLFERNEIRSRQSAIILAGVCVLWITAYLFVLGGVDFVGDKIAKLNRLAASSAASANAVASLLKNLERQILLTVAISLLIYLANIKKFKSSLVTILLVGIVCADLVSANKGFLFSVAPKVILESPTVTIQGNDEGRRIFYYPSPGNLHPSSLFLKGRPAHQETVGLWYRNLLPNAGIFYGLEYMQEIDALGRRAYTDFLSFANGIEPPAQIRLLRAFNVGYVVSFRELSIPGLTLIHRHPQFYSWLYKIERPLPRAYIVNKSVVEKDPRRTLQRLADGQFDPRAEVLLDSEIRINAKALYQATSKILNYQNTIVTIETETNDEGILVFLDAHYPGWKAYVDGLETSIARANHFYRAVRVPQGRHRVEFKYEPYSFQIGLIISSATLLSILVISLVLYLRKRKCLRG